MLAPEIYGGGLGQKYRFVQYHFHWGPNEHEGIIFFLTYLKF